MFAILGAVLGTAVAVALYIIWFHLVAPWWSVRSAQRQQQQQQQNNTDDNSDDDTTTIMSNATANNNIPNLMIPGPIPHPEHDRLLPSYYDTPMRPSQSVPAYPTFPEPPSYRASQTPPVVPVAATTTTTTAAAPDVPLGSSDWAPVPEHQLVVYDTAQAAALHYWNLKRSQSSQVLLVPEVPDSSCGEEDIVVTATIPESYRDEDDAGDDDLDDDDPTTSSNEEEDTLLVDTGDFSSEKSDFGITEGEEV